MPIKIPRKHFFSKLFCKHTYQEGTLSDVKHNPFGLHCISGETYTTICIKCGKIKGTRYVPYQ